MSLPGPDWRASDAERAASVEALGEHYVAGRLDADELDVRSGRALAARHRSELVAVFDDLPSAAAPALAPGAGAVTRHRSGFRWPMALVVLVPLAVVLHAWWLLWLPLLFVVVRRARWRAHAAQTSGRWRGVRGSAA